MSGDGHGEGGRDGSGSGPDKRAKRPLRGRFWRDRRGGVAGEFAILVFPFALLIFATLESCISFAAQEVLSNATDDVARLLRTGQVKAAGLDETKLKGLICERIEIVTPAGCPDLVVDLREYATFEAAAAQRVAIKDKDIDTTGFDVKPGKSMTKNMLRVFYRWPVIADLMSKTMSNLKDNKTLHFASVTWQNEPFDD